MILLFGIAFYLAMFALPLICSYILFKQYNSAIKIALSTIISFSGSWSLFIIFFNNKSTNINKYTKSYSFNTRLCNFNIYV
ncbi:hypothetical protein AS144_06245 [Francisella endosymbiont of Amblyomma maculatum]|nr:hypothetical protein AS144_06245 [Francisella endosymbiont of Amblyomma maculatum]